ALLGERRRFIDELGRRLTATTERAAVDPHDRGPTGDRVASGLVHVELQGDRLVLEVDRAAVGHVARHRDRSEDRVAVPHGRGAGWRDVRPYRPASGGDDHEHSDDGQQKAMTHDAMVVPRPARGQVRGAYDVEETWSISYRRQPIESGLAGQDCIARLPWRFSLRAPVQLRAVWRRVLRRSRTPRRSP